MENYCPVSVLPGFSKVFEITIINQLQFYLDVNNFLSDSQHGFRKGYSTSSAVRSLLNELHWALDRSKIVVSISCDLSKAFDCMDHKIMVQSLKDME